jgi:hypothetical protein
VAHTTNLRAFRDCDAQEPFFRLYTLLVAVELVLKDRAPAHSGGHDLQRLAQRALTPIPAGLSVQLTALAKSLGVLVCTSLKGSRVPLDPAKFPELRYLRHEADFPGDTKSTEIIDALNAAQQLVKELKLAGVSL